MKATQKKVITLTLSVKTGPWIKGIWRRILDIYILQEPFTAQAPDVIYYFLLGWEKYITSGARGTVLTFD